MTKKITKTIHVMTHERAKIGDCGHCGLLSLRNLAQASNSQQGLDLDLGFFLDLAVYVNPWIRIQMGISDFATL